MRNFIQNLKNLKSLTQIFRHLNNLSKANLVNLVNFVMQFFNTSHCSTVSVIAVGQPTNRQDISNLSPTMSPAKVAVKSRISSRLPLLALLMMLTFGAGEMRAQLPYNTTMTKSHYDNNKIVVEKDGKVSCSNSGEISMYKTGYIFPIGTGEWGSWDDKYVIIALNTNSIPYQLKFKYKCSSSIATNPDWYVAESSDKSNWTNIWSTSSKETSWSSEQTVSLSKSTKYIKLCYSGNYMGTFGSIKVTDQAYVHNPTVDEETITSLSFGSGNISSGKAEKTFDIEWCNVNALNVTSDNPTYFTVSPTSFGSKAKYGTQTITVKYDRDVAVGNHNGTITITNGTYTKTVSVSGSTTKRSQAIHWNPDLAAVNYTLNAEDNLTGSAIATADNEEATITYESSNTNIIAVSPDGQTLVAVNNGTATITATATGNDIYNVGTDSKTFTVTAKKKQTISWEQTLVGLKTNASPKTINLSATATSGGAVTYAIEAGSDACVTLSGANNSVMTITGTPGEAYIIATQAGGIIGGEEWISATARKQVKVRDPNSACDEYALADQSFTFGKGDKISMSEKSFNLIGKPTTLRFYAKRGGLKYLWSEQQDMYVEQYANFGSGLEWKQVAAIKPSDDGGNFGPYSLDETATKIRFRSGEYAEQNVSNISIPRKKELVVSETNIIEDAERNVRWSKSISVSRSNIDVVDISVSSSDPSCPFVLNKTSIGTDCSDRSTETFEVSLTPKEKNKTYTGTITITDGKAVPTTHTINLSITTIAFNQAITWSFADNQEFETTHEPLVFDATTDATGLTVSYKIKVGDEDKATLAGNTLTFTASGTLHIIAYQEGSDRYNAAQEIEKTLIITKVTPNIVNHPTGKAIEYRKTLENSTWTVAGSADVTLRGVANSPVAGSFVWNDPTHVVMDATGDHNYSAKFQPTDGGMYNDTTYLQTITILRATQSIEMKNSTVKVAVDGIDAGKADSKIDLDTLIVSQTSDIVNNNERAGAVTYEVISDNKAKATIAAGNIFSATAIGEYTIRATKAQTDYYNAVTADFTVTVGKRANTLTIAGTEYEKFVDEEVTSIRSSQNSDATVQTSSTYPTIAYYDVENNKIVIPNSEATSFKTKIVTIKIWQEATSRFEASGEKTITLTVKKYVTAFTGVAYDIMVDGTQTANYTYTNTSAEQPSVNSNDAFYYAIENVNFTNSEKNNGNDLLTFNVENKVITAKNAGTGVITLRQKETYKYTGDTASYAVHVYKYNSTYAGVSDLEVLVDENVVSGYSLTYTKPNEAYIGAADHAAPAPTLGENSSSCFYTLSHFVTTDITEGSADATKVIAYDAASKTATGKNQGVGTVALTQIETYKYNAATDTFRVMVSKHSNTLTCDWGDWVKAMNKNANASVTFGSNNTNYAQTPIEITQTYGEDVAVLADNNATNKTITTNSTNGYATWYLYQAANYKYNSAEADAMVTVGVPAPPTCYILEDYTEHDEIYTHINDWEGHFGNPIAINAPADKLWFSARRQLGGFDYFVVQYTVDNGAHWRTVVDNPGLSTSYNNYGPYSFPGLQSNEKVTHIRFGANQGATLGKWYKNIKVSRKAYLNIQDVDHNNIATLTMPTNTIGNTTQANIYVDYSTCADEIFIESNNPHFTLSKTSFAADGDNRDSQKEKIVISYTNDAVSKDTAIISVYTSYQRKVIRVIAETNKRAQTLTWQDGFDTDPITVPVGLVVDNTNEAVLASSNNIVTYSSGDEDIVKIINNGYGFQVVGAGATTITAYEGGNDTWLPVSETRNIVATDKIIQEISWHQTFPRTMAIGEEIDLDAKVYLRNTTTGEKTYSADRTAYLTYSCPNNNGIITVQNGKMTVVGYGTTTITARVPGNEDYEAASPVTVSVIVRAPSTGCETPLMFYKGEPIELFLFDFSFTDWETPQLPSDPVYFDLTQGKPDKLSFQHEGEPFSALGREFYGGTILVEERVNNGWSEVPNSRVVPTKNEWHRKENLQLSEGADAIRFIRLAGGTGYHYINDIQVTLRQYLRTTTAAINYGDVKAGEIRNETIVLDYSDLKGDITATQTATDGWLTMANGGDLDIACGTHGQYNLPITFAPTQKGEWKDTIVVYDNVANLELRIPLQANVLESDLFIFETNGDWGTETNWNTNSVPAPNADVAINADVRISTNIAVNSLTISEDATVTIKSGYTLTIGEGKSSERLRYGNLHIEDGAKVVIAEKGKLKINDLHLDASMGSVQANRPASSGEVRGQDSLAINGESYFQIVFDPDQISYGWYDFVVPFDVEMAGGIYLPYDLSTPLANNVDFVIMEFNEDKRALNTRAWTWVNGGTLKAGKLYTIALNANKPERKAFVFKKNAGANIGSTEYAATYSEVGEVKDRGWNGLGNGTLQHCQLNTLPSGTKIQIYDHEQDRYVEREAAEYTYAIGTAFFVQVDEPKTIDLTAVSEQRGFLLPSRIAQTTDEFRLALSRQGETMAADHLWVSANEEATGEYVIGRDLLKMGTPETAKVAQMWATRNDMILCDAEMPLINNAANVNITLCAPYEGNYKLAVEKAPEDADLFLTYKGNVIWNLSSGPYAFKLAKGTTEDYGLRIEARTEQVTPGNNNGALGEEAARKVLINNMLYIVSPEGKMYDATGKSVQ